ncbi:hypothetical protein [Prosthecobacter sp.]|uniref:hypothetical protein n=1 Tax=Prosthecobacter sp. TaxID=1965333 RepID=UPI003784C904
MRTHLLLLVFLFTASLSAADLPTGQATPEAVACDAVMAYINRDSKAWLATLVRPIYGEKGNKEFDSFKKQMAEAADKARTDPSFHPPRIIKVHKARQFSLNGPGSAAYAVALFTGNMFVDIIIEPAPGKSARLRYHVLKDKNNKWYFEPRPDLCPLFSMGLNDESDSTEVLYESP